MDQTAILLVCEQVAIDLIVRGDQLKRVGVIAARTGRNTISLRRTTLKSTRYQTMATLSSSKYSTIPLHPDGSTFAPIHLLHQLRNSAQFSLTTKLVLVTAHQRLLSPRTTSRCELPQGCLHEQEIEPRRFTGRLHSKGFEPLVLPRRVGTCEPSARGGGRTCRTVGTWLLTPPASLVEFRDALEPVRDPVLGGDDALGDEEEVLEVDGREGRAVWMKRNGGVL